MKTVRIFPLVLTLSILTAGAGRVLSQDDQASKLLGARPVKDFVVHGEGFMLKGDTAFAQPNGQFRLEGILVETRRENELNLIVETPFCLYDTARTNVRSESVVLVRSADDRFELSGEGYSFFPKLEELIILSNVMTRFDRSFFESRKLEVKTGSTTRTNSELTVTSGEFEYKGLTGDAEYRDAVRLADGNGLTLDAGMLRFNVDALTNSTREVRAIEKVRIAMETEDGVAVAESHEAIMSTAPGIDGRAVLIGNPRWERGLLSGTAGLLQLLVVSNQFDLLGTNHATMRIPSTLMETNRPAASTNLIQWVDVDANYYRLTPGLLEFHDAVTVVQSTNWSAASRQILLHLNMTNRQPTRAEALGDFEFIVNRDGDHGTGRADRAEFTTDQAGIWRVTLTGEPEWTSSETSTEARVIEVLDPMGSQKITATGDTTITLSGELLAGLNWFEKNTNKEPTKTTSSSTNIEPVKITSDEYVLSGEQAVFTGNVVVSQSTNSLTAPQLTIWFTPERKAKKLYAERGVTAKSGPHTLFAQTVTALFDGPENTASEVRAIDDVEFGDEQVHAVGKTLVYTAETSEAVLDGDPVVTATRVDEATKKVSRVRWESPSITMNLTNKTITGTSPYTIKTLPEEPPDEASTAEPAKL